MDLLQARNRVKRDEKGLNILAVVCSTGEAKPDIESSYTLTARGAEIHGIILVGRHERVHEKSS